MNKKTYLPIIALFTLFGCYTVPAKQVQFPIEKLTEGGYVVFFRHAKRDPVASTARFWEIDRNNSCVPGGDLNSQGREESRRIKRKIEELSIPVGEVIVSPTCRTKSMAKIIFGDAFEISNGIAPVWVNKEKVKNHRYPFLIEKLKQPTEQGKNRFLISHGGVLNEETVGRKVTLGQSDAGVFKPSTDSSGYTFLGIIPREEWR